MPSNSQEGDALEPDEDDLPLTGRLRIYAVFGIVVPYALAAAIVAANRVQQQFSDEFNRIALTLLALWIATATVLIAPRVSTCRAIAFSAGAFAVVLLALIQWALYWAQ